MKSADRKLTTYRALAPNREYFVVCCGRLSLEKSHCSSGLKRRPAALETQNMTPMDGLMPAGARMAGAAEVLRRTCAYAVFQAPPQADEKFSRL